MISMASWAREQALSNVDLTILAIEPPPWEGYPRREPSGYAPTSGLVFSIIHLGELEDAITDIAPFAPGAWAPDELDPVVPSAYSLSLSGSYARGRE